METMEKRKRDPKAGPPRTPEVMSVAQLAEFLGVHERTAWGLVSSGAIPSSRVGRNTVRVQRADVIGFLDERKNATAR